MADGRITLPVVYDEPEYDNTPARRPRVRAKTLSIKRLSKRDLDAGRALYPEAVTGRPQTRAECVGGPRPCPYVSCEAHLYLDVNDRTGSIKMNFPDLEVWELPETCALDTADRGGITLEEVGAIMNLTRERIRQLEMRAMDRVRATVASGEVAVDAPDREVVRGRTAPERDADTDDVSDVTHALGLPEARLDLDASVRTTALWGSSTVPPWTPRTVGER